MPKDNRIDAYIAKSADFAKPILNHIREVVHKACPHVQETIKWGFPHFDYEGIMCSMASFKQHCAFGFWNGSLMKDPKKILAKENKTSMGHLGQIKSLRDLPPDKVLIQYIKEAARMNEEGVKRAVKKPAAEKKELKVPEMLKKALAKNKIAQKTFTNFSYSHRKEYIEWIDEAKTEETKNKRVATTIEWLTEGKARNWKYMKK